VYSFKTLDDIDVSGKRVLVRVDINSPLDKKTMTVNDRSKIASAVPTLKELSAKGAKVTVLAHQGRKNHWDYTDLHQHAEILSELLGKKVRYIDDLMGDLAKEAIKSLKGGEIILLKNVRCFDSETVKLSVQHHSQGALVSSLAPLFDIFINDAFASSHRSQASIVGFTVVLPSVAGRLMQKEISILLKFIESPSRPVVFVFGGTKFIDSIPIIRHLLDTGIADKVIVGGLVGMAYASIAGNDIGEENRKTLANEMSHEHISDAKQILEKHASKIIIPVDMATDKDGKRVECKIGKEVPALPCYDIGSKSMKKFGDVLSSAKTIFISGPVGMFEKEEFSLGTRAVFEKSTSSGAFCITGGGHTTAAANQMSFSKKITYMSTGGGALEHFLLGKPLPALEALKNSI